MKVVIGIGINGFHLSHEAFLRLREMGNKYALSEPDYGERWPDDPDGEPRPIDDNGFMRVSGIPRNDPDLVSVVEQLGEKAAAPRRKLKVVEVPEDVDWEIEEDSETGAERVVEKHRIWY